MESREPKTFPYNEPFADLFFVVSISIDNLSPWFWSSEEEGTSLVIFKAIVGFHRNLHCLNFDVTDKAVIVFVESIVALTPSPSMRFPEASTDNIDPIVGNHRR